ncbi:MAG: glucohydrolase [Clostridia bacterium]|nr:glucohydrolase [Clostridia bacterium]
MEKKWWHQSVVYQIYPKSFNDSNGDGIGDLQGITDKLDYLKELGIDVIWLSPVYQSPMKDNGYDISDYHDMAPEFGCMKNMEELISKAKDRNIKIIMDLVVNHTSDKHLWFKEAKKSKDSPYRDYYIWRSGGADGSPPNDLKSAFGGSAWEYDETTEQYYAHLFAKEQPDLNWENPKVRDEIHKMMNWWLDKGISGFRMDVIDLIGKEIDRKITTNGPHLHKYIKEMNEATFGKYDVLTVGETWSATPEIAKTYSNQDRQELSMIFQFEHITVDWDEVHSKWLPKDLDFIKLKKVLNKWQTKLGNEGWNALFWNNHDLPRVVSKRGNVQEYRVESAKMLATLLHFMKGTPYIYQGEEIGMTNVKFENLGDYDDIEIYGFYREKIKEGFTQKKIMEAIWENGRDNARTPMQWSEEKNAGFTEGSPWIKVNPNYKEINVAKALQDESSIFYHYQKLIKLRRQMEVIVYGSFNLICEESPNIFAYTRTLGKDRLLVINNFFEQRVNFILPKEIKYDTCKPIISNYSDASYLPDYMTLRPYESVVYLLT